MRPLSPISYIHHVLSAADLQARLSAPRPKQTKVQSFVPKAKPKRKPKKEASFLDKFKAHRDRFFG